jgi:focal adhesion kinase 1
MADFSQVQSIQTSAADNKGFLQIKVAGATEPLTITCASVDDAEDMADLIDGYCRLVHDISTSVWSRKGEIIIDLLCNDKWRTIYQNSKMYVE